MRQSILSLSSIYKCYFFISLFFVLSLIGGYPGEMSPDSFGSFRQSLENIYSVHNSPLFSYTWHLLNYISTGPFVMLLLQEAMLWLSVVIFVNSWYKKNGYSKAIWVFILIPFFPSILKLSPIIWKDVHFAFAYLLATSILVRYTLLKELKPNLLIKIILPVILFYGTACKFQALYIAPVFILWYLVTILKINKKITSIALVMVISVLCVYSIIFINGKLANDKEGNHRFGWEEREFNDLLYISKTKNKALLPQYITEDPQFNFGYIRKNYRINMAYHMIYDAKESPIKFTIDPLKQQKIHQTWLHAVTHYPFTYLKGRYKSTFKMLYGSIHSYSFIKTQAENYKQIEPYVIKEMLNNYVGSILNFYTNKFRYITPLIICLPLMILYLWYSCKLFLVNKDRFALVTLFMNGAALFFILVMFFTAVNLDYRYLFICHVLFHFSHPFAWRVINETKDAKITKLLSYLRFRSKNMFCANLTKVFKFLLRHKVKIGSTIVVIILCMSYKSELLNRSRFVYYISEDKSFNSMADEQIMDDIAILIPSCDKYSELWDININLLLKYWPDLNGKYKSIPIFLISNKVDYHNSRVQVIKTGEDPSWSDNMILALNQIKQRNILLILDDYIINKYVNEKRLIELVRTFKKYNAPYMSISYQIKEYYDGYMLNDDLMIKNRRGHYRNSTQISLWQKKDFLSLLKPGESAWDFEIIGNKRTRNYLRPFFWVTENYPFSYLNAVDKKTYRGSVVDYVNKEGFNFHPTKLPIDPNN